MIASALTMAYSSAMAADQPFFTLTEISDNDNEYGYKLAAKADVYSNIVQKYDWWSYFDSLPTEISLGDYHTYLIGCIYDSAVCNSYYDSDIVDDGKTHSFFKALHENTSYMSSKLSYGEELDMFQGIRTNLGTDGTTMITGWVENQDRTGSSSSEDRSKYFEAGVRYPVVWSSGSQVYLEGKKKGFGTASSSLQTSDGSFLIGGANSETNFTDTGYFYYCYSRYDEDDFMGAMRNCPGYSNEPVVWAFDPSGNKVLAKQVFKHYRPADLDGDMNLADIKAVVKYGEKYYAFGHSATNKTGPDTLSISTWWSFDYSNGTFSNVSDAHNADGIDRPGEDDKHYGATWFVDANDNGYAIGNIRFTSLNHLNYPVEMFLFKISDEKASIPLENYPFKGATNRAVAINNNNLVVGVADDEDSQYATVGGTPREQEAFIYNVESSKFYPLNDLICTSSTCEINGKYYYIYNVGDINDNNVIIANAYRYDSNSDWANYHNAHNVTIMLTSDKFINGKDVDENFRVKYERKEITYGEDKSGGGSGSTGGLAVLLLGGLCWYRMRKSAR